MCGNSRSDTSTKCSLQVGDGSQLWLHPLAACVYSYITGGENDSTESFFMDHCDLGELSRFTRSLSWLRSSFSRGIHSSWKGSRRQDVSIVKVAKPCLWYNLSVSHAPNQAKLRTLSNVEWAAQLQVQHYSVISGRLGFGYMTLAFYHNRYFLLLS